MPVVLDNDAGERVLLYGADGATLRKVVVNSSGQLVVVGPGGGGAIVVSATDLDIRNLVKTLDELYAVLRTDGGTAYDARDRSWTVTETVPVTQSTPDNLRAGIYGRIAGAWQRQPLILGYSAEYSEQVTVVGVAGTTTVNGSAVTANTLRILTAISVINLTRLMTQALFRLQGGSTVRFLVTVTQIPAAGAGWMFWAGSLPTLQAPAIDVSGTLAGDDVRAQFQGYDMTLNL